MDRTWGGGGGLENHYPKISETIGRMPTKLLPDGQP